MVKIQVLQEVISYMLLNLKFLKADEKAKESDITLNVLETVLKNYQELEKEGYGDLGTQALMKYYKKP